LNSQNFIFFMTIEVLLTGSFGVGKSSIFNRIIHDTFSSNYYGTMGVRVNEKVLEDQGITIKLWDIAGEIHQRKVPKIYFAKKTVILYIIDITRPFTFGSILEDLQYLKENVGEAIVKVIGNKKDLLTEAELIKVQEEELPIVLQGIVSAKTGENLIALINEVVEEARLKVKNN